ncbi:hypothetical protein [Rhizobium leguminosarum]|uniref:hypothetical protein n=1 Tax=Rhizobium leguminosarum TaxID=384 RepID=UPI003917E8B0
MRIATTCGFADVNAMRRVFAKTIGVIPNEYRSRFQTSSTPSKAAPITHVPGHSGSELAIEIALAAAHGRSRQTRSAIDSSLRDGTGNSPNSTV